MADQITREIFDHLVELAALELIEDEAEYLRGQLNNQLKAIQELVAIPLDDATPIASHGVPYTDATSADVRPDTWSPYPDPNRILNGAPEVGDGYFIVPEIPHQDLD